MELLHRRTLAAVKEEGGKIVNPEIIPAYSAYQEVIDLTLYHAFVELIVQTAHVECVVLMSRVEK